MPLVSSGSMHDSQVWPPWPLAEPKLRTHFHVTLPLRPATTSVDRRTLAAQKALPVVHAVDATERADEALLAEAAREGSGGPAFVELLERHRERVWRLCYRLLGNKQDASDAAQEVFVRLFLHRNKF